MLSCRDANASRGSCEHEPRMSESIQADVNDAPPPIVHCNMAFAWRDGGDGALAGDVAKRQQSPVQRGHTRLPTRNERQRWPFMMHCNIVGTSCATSSASQDAGHRREQVKWPTPG